METEQEFIERFENGLISENEVLHETREQEYFERDMNTMSESQAEDIALEQALETIREQREGI